MRGCGAAAALPPGAAPRSPCAARPRCSRTGITPPAAGHRGPGIRRPGPGCGWRSRRGAVDRESERASKRARSASLREFFSAGERGMLDTESVPVSFRHPRHGGTPGSGLSVRAAGSAPRGAAGGDPPPPRAAAVGARWQRRRPVGGEGPGGHPGHGPQPVPPRGPEPGGAWRRVGHRQQSAVRTYLLREQCGAARPKLPHPLNAPGSQ